MRKQFKKLGIICALCALTAGVGFGVQNLQTASAENLAPDLKDNGASVRVDKDGVRFTFSVNKSYKEAGYTYGTLIIPKAVLGDKELNHNDDAADAVELSYEHVAQNKWATEAYKEIKAEDETHFYEEGREYFNAVLSTIPETFYGTTLVARSYAVKDGVYYYSNTVERSIAQVAAAALNNGETGDKLTEYVDTALTGKALSMNVRNAYVATGSEQTLDVLNDNGYKAIWTSSDKSVATVDANGKVTAMAEGKATLTAKLGSQTFTSNVQVGTAPEGEKITAWNSDFIAKNVVDVKDSNGNGACGRVYNDGVKVFGGATLQVKSESGYARFKLYSDVPMSMQCEKVVFYVYVAGAGQYCNGVSLTSNSWTKIEISTSDVKYVQVSFHTKDYASSNQGGVFYVSDVYGMEVRSVKLLVSMKDSIVNGTFTKDGNATVTYVEDYTAYGAAMAKVNPNENWQVSGYHIGNVDVSGYSKVVFKVFRPGSVEGGYFLRIKSKINNVWTVLNSDCSTAKAAGEWIEYTFDASAFANKNLNNLLIQFGTADSTTIPGDPGKDGTKDKYILISDIYGIK